MIKDKTLKIIKSIKYIEGIEEALNPSINS